MATCDNGINNINNSDKLTPLSVLVDYAPLVKSRALLFLSSGCELEDLIQEGSIGLYSASLTYNCELSAFGTFARRCIDSAIIDYLRRKVIKFSTMDVRDELIDRLIDLSFAEDIGDGDHTTLSTIPAEAMGKNMLLIKEDGVLAGIDMAKRIFARFDPALQVEVLIEDGAEVKKGDIAMYVTGSVRSLLQTERLMLNVMQRMSGIATMTRRYVRELEGTNTRVLDTRKTTPGMRIMEKEAVRIGGGVNHRIGLFDMILIKDNHVDFAGGIEQAVSRAKEYCKACGKDLKIEVEVRTLEDLQKVIDMGGIQRIMFDNFDTEKTRKAVEMVAGRYETESSGGITFDTLRDYALCGVDFISVGALTHSVKGLDMSFKAVK